MTSIVIDNSIAPTPEAPKIRDASRIGWDNAYTRATIVGGGGNPELYDAVRDNMTNIFYQPSSVNTDFSIQAVFDNPEDINWIGVAAGNWATAEATINVYTNDPVGGTILQGQVTGLRDGDPFMWVFDTVLGADLVSINIVSNGNIKIGEVGCGKTLDLPCLPSLGMEWGRYNNLDEIIGRKTENDLFASASVLPRARRFAGNYELTPIDWIRTDWVPFSDTHKGKLVWFMWDVFAHPFDVAFGHWNAGVIAYDRSTYANINLEIMGDIR